MSKPYHLERHEGSCAAPFSARPARPFDQRTQVSGVAVVHVSGDIDFREMVEIKQEIGRFLMADKKNVVLNLAQVDHVNYLSIGVLIGSLKILRGAGGDLKLAGMQPQVKIIFQAVGMDQFFEDYATVEEAVESFGEEWMGMEERPQ